MAIVAALLAVLSMILWFVGLVRSPEGLASLRAWWWRYFATEFVSVSIYAWVLRDYARSRHWAFVTTLFLAPLQIWSNVVAQRPTYAAFGFVLFAYSVARLFGILSPRPLRRLDLLPK